MHIGYNTEKRGGAPAVKKTRPTTTSYRRPARDVVQTSVIDVVRTSYTDVLHDVEFFDG